MMINNHECEYNVKFKPTFIFVDNNADKLLDQIIPHYLLNKVNVSDLRFLSLPNDDYCSVVI